MQCGVKPPTKKGFLGATFFRGFSRGRANPAFAKLIKWIKKNINEIKRGTTRNRTHYQKFRILQWTPLSRLGQLSHCSTVRLFIYWIIKEYGSMQWCTWIAWNLSPRFRFYRGPILSKFRGRVALSYYMMHIGRKLRKLPVSSSRWYLICSFVIRMRRANAGQNSYQNRFSTPLCRRRCSMPEEMLHSQSSFV